MHMEHCKPVLDAVDLRLGQHVLMASRRAAVVHNIKAQTVVFRYLDFGPDNFVEIPRKLIPETVRT